MGPAKRPVDGVVIVRTVEPQNDPTASFLQGLYAGLADAGVPAVGAERSSDDASVIGVFKNAGLSDRGRHRHSDREARPRRAALGSAVEGQLRNEGIGAVAAADSHRPGHGDGGWMTP